VNRVVPYTPAWAARRDAYVLSHPAGTLFHLSAWPRALAAGFGFRHHDLLALEGDELAGVLPLTEVRRPLLGRALVSTAACVCGGALAGSAGTRERLEDAAAALGRERGVAYVELRNRERAREDWPVSHDYCRFGFALEPDTDRVLARIPRKRRAEIRKGAAAGLALERDTDLRRFYPLYARGVRDLGSPPFPRRFLEALLAELGERAEITIARAGARPVLGLMSFWFREEVLPYFVGALPEAKALRAFDHVYWDLACRAAARGCRWFDFGRSLAGSGAYASKKTWGLEPQPLAYQYHLVRAPRLPRLNPANPALGPVIALWRRLPLPIATRLGPWLSPLAL